MHVRSRLALPLVLVSLVTACGPTTPEDDPPLLHVPSPAWEDQVIYFVMTDRFANGDPSNDDQGRGELDPASPAHFSGGDLQGIIDRLDYIQGLGATAVWITPPVANMWWDPLQQYGGYHGYWARDLQKVDEHFGTLDTYKKLSDALHRRGMYLIQDVVPNHMGNFFQYSRYDPADVAAGFVRNGAAVPSDRPTQPPFDQNDATDPAQRAAAIYHWTPAISDYSSADQEVNWQISDLDDLNTENPVVRKALRASYGYWIREVGVDAFRVDTAKFAPHAFWNDFFHAADAEAPGMHAVAKATGRERFFAFGEVYETSEPLADTAEAKVASFLGTAGAPELPAVLNFPLYGEIDRVFAAGRPTAYLSYRLQRSMDRARFPNPHAMPTFIDNHDVRRFLSVSNRDGLAQALAFLFTAPGIPVVYYGTEQLFTENRAAMFRGGYKNPGIDQYLESTFYKKVQKLSALRKDVAALRRGELEVLYDSHAGAGPFAYRRTLEGASVLVLMNTSTEKVLVNDLDTKLPAGTVLEVLHAEKDFPVPPVGAGGRLRLELPARAVLVARASAQQQTPPAPTATLTVATALEGQTFQGDVTVTGTVTPANTPLRMVVDDSLDRATPVSIAADGTWTAVLPVSSFPNGVHGHTVSFYAPFAQAASPRYHFTSDTAFQGETYTYDDPTGDDTGPRGTYTYPQDATFRHQMDIDGVTLEVGATVMNLKIHMADWSKSWNPSNGFDHVAFNVYLALPGSTGTSVMPRLSATTPDGFAWTYTHFAFGWESVKTTTSSGASATAYGPTASWNPKLTADEGTKTVTFTYDRTALGLASWSGVKLYVATWDYDGIGAAFRELTPAGGQWAMGGGATTDPKVMDDLAPITVP